VLAFRVLVYVIVSLKHNRRRNERLKYPKMLAQPNLFCLILTVAVLGLPAVGLGNGTPFPAFLFQICCAASQNNYPAVRGTITDENLNPLKRVQVTLTGQENPQTSATTWATMTGNDGRFILQHKPCHVCVLEVLPPKSSHLAAARFSEITGTENRQVVIELKHGYEVQGRITHKRKGLRDMTVAFSPVGQDLKPNSIHDGGWAKTNRDGRFNLILTPGLKCMHIGNERYPELLSSYQRKLSVTSDGSIPDVELPSVPECRHEPQP